LTLKVKALLPSEASATVYQLTWCKVPEDLNLQQHHCENLKSCKHQKYYIEIKYFIQDVHKHYHSKSALSHILSMKSIKGSTDVTRLPSPKNKIKCHI
jgi:hypothetical protein